MCMELLRTIAGAQLPFTIADQTLIDRLRVLDAVGYVKAFIPAVHVDCDDCARQDPATVIEITPRGREALSKGIEGDLPAATGMQAPACGHPQEEPSRGAHLAWWHGSRRLRSGGYGPIRP
jgi:hypothetical protein